MLNSTELAHRAAISDVIFAYARSLDRHEWNLLRSILTDEVDTDFTAATGQPPARLQAEQLVQGLQHLLGREGLKTQHLSTNHTYEITEPTATATSYYVAQHFLPDLTDSKSFIVHGYYTWHLNVSSGKWQISGIKVHVDWISGTPDILNY